MSIANSFHGHRSSSSLSANRLVPLAAAVALYISASTRAATITVNDPTAGSVAGDCTIVDAVTAINTQTAVNGCMAGDGNNDTIDLTGFTVPTTITFTQSVSGYGHALALSQPAAITGALDSSGTPYVTLERSSVSGTPDFGLIQTNEHLTLYGLTLSNGSAQAGYSGGAIQAGSPLTVGHCVISGNTSGGGGGAILATNGLTLNYSTISGNTAASTGGGVVSNSYVHMYDSTVTGNSTTSAGGAGGGGIYSSGSILVSYSTISDNTSAAKGGGIFASSIALFNSTISSNTALDGTGGGVYSGSDASLTNSTITGNISSGSGGGIYAQTVAVNYSTVFANTAQSGIGGGVNFTTSGSASATILYGNSPDDLNTASHNTLSGSYNLIGVSGWGVPVDTISCDPMLGTLGNYGGPTMTLPLMSGSCALYGASSTPSQSTDQRGYPRPAQGEDKFKADIGAFERQPSDDPDLIFANGFELE